VRDPSRVKKGKEATEKKVEHPKGSFEDHLKWVKWGEARCDFEWTFGAKIAHTMRCLLRKYEERTLPQRIRERMIVRRDNSSLESGTKAGGGAMEGGDE
jgi:hypothetical protein